MTQQNFNNNSSTQQPHEFSRREDEQEDLDNTTNNQQASNNQADNLLLKIAELEQKNNELNDKLLRTLAEVDNVRRRSREELEKTSKFAISNFVSELVVIVENFLMASSNAPNDEIDKIPAIKNYATAITLTEKELLKILEKNQVKRIFPLNEKFDHNLHEAISHMEFEGEEGVILQVVQAGYAISGRIIRPALVVVSKAKIS
ncbi:MAG: nucleotide exchange factor GrpE [Alphaproteobacteria bacterium]